MSSDIEQKDQPWDETEGFCMKCLRTIDPWDQHDCAICMMPFCKEHKVDHDCSEYLEDAED